MNPSPLPPSAPTRSGGVRILHLEDSEPDALLVADRISQDWPGCAIRHADGREQFEAALAAGPFDLILSDYTLRGFDGLSALELARARCPQTPFIFLSGTIGEERAIDALKRGATDYVIKDRPSRLIPAMRQALTHAAEEKHLRETEESLRQHREHLRQITENIADLILMAALDGRCVYCNPAYAAATGRAPDQAGFDLFADIHPQDQAPARQVFAAAVRGEPSARTEYRLRRADRGVRTVEAQHSVVRDAAGAIRQILLVLRDVTERRAAEERIRHQAALLDRAQDAILVRDMEDRVTYWNQSAARIYGWTAAEAAGRETTGLWNEDPAQVEIARHATLFYGEWTGEMHQRSRAGADLVMQSRWSLVQTDDGAPAGFLVINTDIAERKRLEAQFLRVQRVESIGLLASGVAHDINNVLVPILASTELLEPLTPTPEAKQFLTSIRSSAQHGAALVRQLLAFARGAVGQHVELPLPPLLEDFIAFTAQTFPKNIGFQIEVARDIWPVRGDATQLKQVLVNLCINARDAMPAGGEITLKLRNVVLTELEAAALREVKSGPHCVLEVADNGPGMPAGVLAKIFDPFFTTKPLGKGTGLGLAAVRGIVKGHEGAIAVESTPGVGTTFRLYLPAITTGRRESNPPVPVSQPQGAGQSILLIDDEATVRDILSALLVASGYRVFKAANGSEALAVFRERRHDIALILTDVMMSDSDGFEVIANLRRENYRGPILAMSGLAGNGTYEAKAKALGVPILGKPLTRDTLVRAVQTALAATNPS